MRLVILLFICGTIVASNDTITNEIPDDRDKDLKPKRSYTGGNRTVAEIFENAVQAYLEEDWDGCIEGFNQALYEYKLYKRIVTNCRQKCRAIAAGSEPLFPENIDDLYFYERKVRETLCLLKCDQDHRETAGWKIMKKLSRETEQKFFDRRPYEYLHICYYQRNRHQDAASAVFTYLVRNPGHQASVETLTFYLTLPDVHEDQVLNLEGPPYLTMYYKGVAAYEDEDFANAAGFFESSLRSYMESEEECRLYCEGSFDQGWHPEFTSSVANHFAYCLKCKRGCSGFLNSINGDVRRDMLRSHYNYLQFSYYKLAKLQAACAAVESYLLFDPADETMLHNRKYYSAQPMVREEYFIPRQEAVSYVKREEYEMKLMHYIAEEFTKIDDRLKAYAKKKKDSEKKEQKETGKEPSSPKLLPPGRSPRTQLTGNLSMTHDEEKTHDTTRPGVTADVYLIADEKKLGGKNRYVADGFLKETECGTLMQLAQDVAIEGDGYTENKSPHSIYERFEGVTIGRAALMAYFGKIETEQLDLLLRKTEAARSHVERYFGLDRHLYFTYTHLVCRTALPDSPLDRSDLSHEVHADNCLLLNETTCSRESPAYVWRDYSAILYLNDDFLGAENLHGVRGVLEGKRCALALWFTQDEKYVEYERILAEAILKRVRSVGPSDGKGFEVPLRYEDTLMENVRKDELIQQLLRNSS